MINCKTDRIYLERFCNWFIKTIELEDKVEELDKRKNVNNGKHPIRPKKGDIYMVEFGQNIGKELSNRHMAIVMQNSTSNIASHTVNVIPISSSKHPNPTHITIKKEDIKTGKLNKLPSIAKVDQITCIDKARMVYKIGSVTENFMNKLELKIIKNLDIKAK